MYLLDYSIDNLSLMALTISTGFVVDDAIVVTENIARLIEDGKKPLRRRWKGPSRSGSHRLDHVSLIAVFIPILLMGGIIGRLFREFAVTLSIAVALSAIVSLTVTPTMAGRLLRPVNERGSGRFPAPPNAFAALVRGTIARCAGCSATALLMAFLTICDAGLTVCLAIRVPKGLFPQQDTGMLSGFSEAAQDVSSGAMRKAQEKVNKIVQDDPDVTHTIAFVGGSSGAGNTGTMFITLKDYNKRKSNANQIITRLRPQLARVPGITLFLQSVQDVRMGGRSSRTQYQYALEDADLAELQAWGPRVLDRLKKLPQLRDVATDQQTAGLELAVDVDRDRASQLGITAQMVDDTLYDAFGQRQVATSFTPLNYYRVVLETTPEQYASPDQLVHVYVRGAGGQLVPLPSIAHLTERPTPLAITHQGQFPATTLSFNLAPGSALGDAVKAIDAAERQIGLPSGIHASFQGTAQAFGASLSSEPWLIAAALFIVYIVLGMLYESLVHPITILSTLPSAALGALIALIVFHFDFSIIALIGVILLLGIVKKNAIMMIDFALEAERHEGLEPDGHSPGLSAAVPSDPDDHAGGAVRRSPAGRRLRRRLRAAPAAGHHHRRRPLRLPAPEPLLDAGDLPLPRSPPPRQRGRASNRHRGGPTLDRRRPGLDTGNGRPRRPGMQNDPAATRRRDVSAGRLTLRLPPWW